MLCARFLFVVSDNEVCDAPRHHTSLGASIL